MSARKYVYRVRADEGVRLYAADDMQHAIALDFETWCLENLPPDNPDEFEAAWADYNALLQEATQIGALENWPGDTTEIDQPTQEQTSNGE